MYEQEKIKPYDSEGDKRKQVEQMFDNISSTYDLLNHSLSLGIDKGWRKRAIDSLRAFNPRHMLDIATGTGDFAILAAQRLQPESLIGADISEGMMNIGRKKVQDLKLEQTISFQKEDCTNLSFPENSFDAVTVAYGVRNFDNLDLGLKEMHRVLRPDGHLLIVELCTPNRFPMKQLFQLYSRVVMPLAGRLISKDRSAYSYLPATMEAFPQGEVMQQIIYKAGFRKVSFKRFTGGICTMYLARK